MTVRDTGSQWKFFLKYAGRFKENYDGTYAEFGEICAEICSKYAAYMRLHVEMRECMRIFAYAA